MIWSTERGQKQIERFGPVEWDDDDGCEAALRRNGHLWTKYSLASDGDWFFVGLYSDHEAACIHNDWAERVWIKAKGEFVYTTLASGKTSISTIAQDGEEDWVWGDTKAEALVVALESLESEKCARKNQ